MVDRVEDQKEGSEPSEDSAAAEDWTDLSLRVGRVFTPTSPIDERSLFAGRDEQVRLIVDVINQKGQHAILYGERGVGKTSIANVLASFLEKQASTILAPRVNCDSTDSYDSVWRKVFESIELTKPRGVAGFGAVPQVQRSSVADMLTGPVTPNTVRRTLTTLAQQALLIVIVDEFDRLGQEARRAFADTIKTLSDHAVGASVVLVGVADSVEHLIEEHRSVERALVQVRMPRMSVAEIKSILVRGTRILGMTMTATAVSRIAKLAQGLPHYAHLLGLYAARSATADRRKNIDVQDIGVAIKRAISGAQQSIRSAYDIAVRSPRKDNLFGDVLLSCALAESNELGFFAAQDLREPMRKVTGRRYEIPSYAQHLTEFCDDKRGHVLFKDGTRRRFRYRFVDPLLQPFVIMRGLDSKRISAEHLD